MYTKNNDIIISRFHTKNKQQNINNNTKRATNQHFRVNLKDHVTLNTE